LHGFSLFAINAIKQAMPCAAVFVSAAFSLGVLFALYAAAALWAKYDLCASVGF
jgi:hypothetical protein